MTGIIDFHSSNPLHQVLSEFDFEFDLVQLVNEK